MPLFESELPMETLQEVLQEPQKFKEPFICHICQRSFMVKQYLKQHMIVHVKEKKFPCNKCDKSFALNSHLKAHMNSHAEIKPFKCDKCEKRYTYNSDLLRHLQGHAGRSFACAICQKGFKCTRSLKKHLLSHTGERPFSCELCAKDFATQDKLRIHLRLHTGERPFSCEVCQKSFIAKDCLHRHLAIHDADKRFICEVCHKRFSCQPSLNQHVATHNPIKKFVCHVCKKGYTKKKGLDRHTLTHTKEHELLRDKYDLRFTTNHQLVEHSGVKPFLYPDCHTQYDTKKGYQNHLKEHVRPPEDYTEVVDFSKKLPYVCALCGKGCKNSINYGAHMSLHNGLYLLYCEKCGKGFTDIKNFKEHFTKHDVKLFYCNTCEAGFYIACAMEKHIKFCGQESSSSEITNDDHDNYNNHETVILFKCNVCGDAFDDIKLYYAHVCEHTGLYPLQCKKCDKSFFELKQFEKHGYAHISVDLICNVCQTEFSSNEALLKHVDLHISEQPNIETERTGLAKLGSSKVQGNVKTATCYICDRKFQNMTLYRLHMCKHVGVHPYHCETCNEGFFNADDLTAHAFTHANVKPFVCGKCEQRYFYASELRAHMKNKNCKKIVVW